MQKLKLSDSGARGWFIGDFPEAIHRTRDFEVCYQVTPVGKSPTHFHKIVKEIQLITRGKMIVNGETFEAGDICILEPGEICECEIVEELNTVCIKTPSVPNDKYYV
jgi:hypothetical protein